MDYLLITLYLLSSLAVVSATSMEEEVGDTEFKYHSFQVDARAGKQECFYQLFDHNTTLALIWQVLGAGGSGELAVTMTVKKEPDMRILYTSGYGQMGDFREENLERGTYEFCIDNVASYTSKNVYMWIDYQKKKSWGDAVSEDSVVQKFQLKQDLLRDILRTLEARLHDMAYFQTIYRQNNFYDEAVLLSLHSIINQRSLAASAGIIMSGLIQVIFIRKLFSLPQKTVNAGI